MSHQSQSSKLHPQFQSQMVHSGMFALRTALLPFNEFFREADANPWADAAVDLQAAIANDRTMFRCRLKEIVSRPMMREAIFLASPTLHDQIDAWLSGNEDEPGGKVEKSLLRYVSRSCGRATPFGLFAGCSVGRIGARTRLVIEGRENYRRHTRLDMEYICALATAIASASEYQGQLKFRPNSTLYRCASVLRYAEARWINGQRTYHLVSVEESDFLNSTLERAKSGATAVDLTDALVDEDISQAEAAAFIAELISTQLLVPELEPSVTGPQPLHALINQLVSHEQATPIYEKLVDTRDVLAAWDTMELGIDTTHYYQMADSLKSLPAPVQLSRLFQVDMTKPSPEATLGPEVMQELEHAIEVLHSMATPVVDTSLAAFRSAFRNRYGDRMIPLAEVLDEETGIGFERSNAPAAESEPLLAGLSFPALGQSQRAWTGRDQFLLHKLSATLATAGQHLELTQSDLKRLANEKPAPLPDAISAVFSVAAASDEAFDRGEFSLCALGFGGPSGARLLGRFCHIDEKLAELVQSHIRAEEAHRPDAVFAEIVHLPEGRIGNVLLRPVLRDFEIPFAGRSGTSDERQITIDDLLVKVEGDLVLLFSKRLGREVIARMSTAHNFTWNSLGAYRFLGQLQTQGVCQWLGWSWGALEGAPFLPRVTCGRLILAKARWTLTEAEICDRVGSESIGAIQILRQQRNLPRFVALVEGDNELAFDLERVLCVELLLENLKLRGSVTLTEIFPEPNEMPARGPEGRFVHEIIVPCVRQLDARPPARVVSLPVPADSFVPRQFAPGTEWLYINVYCGSAGADVLLRELVRPLADQLLSSTTIDRWFFIRYSDPDWHLRLRLHGEPSRLLSEALPLVERMTARHIGEGRVSRWTVGTYERELERYGGSAAIELCEEVFFHDSVAALSIIEAYQGDAGLEARWRLAVLGIDCLLTDLGCELSDKLQIMRPLRDGMSAEFHAELTLNSQIGQKFRLERRNLEAALNPENTDLGTLAIGNCILEQRSLQLQPPMQALELLENQGRLTINRRQIAPAFIHMFANRLLRSAHRPQELVLYDFLTRYYESQVARAKRQPIGRPV